MQVNGHAALVTGGGSGLGAASARALAAQGARVAVLDVNLAAAEAVAAAIGGIALACDVADAASAEGAVEAAEARHGTARILVNCAGVAPGARIVGRNGPMDLAAFRRVIEINLIGSFNMVRLMAAAAAKLEPLDTTERGVIISTASIAAFEGQIGQTAYAASKAGVVGFTLPAARELAAYGIRVCAIAPGIFETPMVQGFSAEIQAALGAAVPFPPRLGKPDEFAKLVLAVIDNPMLNGEVIRLDGAIRMAPR